MRKITFLCLSILLASCSQNEEWQGTDADEAVVENALESLSEDYELVLKGYTLEELSKEKDETTPTTQKETRAEPELMKALENSLKGSYLANYSKTRTDARAYGGVSGMVGVFKAATCGGYREFIYNMDCEDGGNTNVDGTIGATSIDGSGNVTFRFCVVPAGDYGGGTLLLYNYQWNGNIEGEVDIVARNHDNEDHDNRNRILDNGGLASTGLSRFDKNTTFYWRFSNGPARNLNFQYGVLNNITPGPGSGILFIDDENGSNANHATLWSHRIGQTTSRALNYGESFKGMRVDHNTAYHIGFRQ